MGNRAARRALTSLSHPLTAGSVVLLLVNDFILRPLVPSWLTGKLGDAAFLVFAPLVVAFALSWVVPSRLRQQERVVGWLSLALAGLSFALVKGIPATHDAALRVVEAVIGVSSRLIADPADLLVLPALLVPWHVWRTSDPQERPLPRFGLTVLALAALATMADAPAPDYGIDCIESRPDGSLITRSSWGDFNSYASHDGGLSWQPAELEHTEIRACEWHNESWEISPPGSGDIVYRLAPGVGIDRSADGGATWTREVELRGSQALSVYRERSSSAASASPGPLEAIIDPTTGNLVVAMGHDGVLTRSADGTWHPVAVGPYQPERIDTVSETLSLLTGELILAATLTILALNTFSLFNRGVHWLALVLLAVGWLLWLVIVLLSPAPNLIPANYIGPFVYFGMAINAALAASWLALSGLRAYRQRGGWQRAALTAILATLLFMLPYILWTVGGIPRYSTAMIFALLLSATTLFAGGWWVRHGLPVGTQRQPVIQLRRKPPTG